MAFESSSVDDVDGKVNFLATMTLRQQLIIINAQNTPIYNGEAASVLKRMAEEAYCIKNASKSLERITTLHHGQLENRGALLPTQMSVFSVSISRMYKSTISGALFEVN